MEQRTQNGIPSGVTQIPYRVLGSAGSWTRRRVAKVPMTEMMANREEVSDLAEFRHTEGGLAIPSPWGLSPATTHGFKRASDSLADRGGG